MGDLLTVRVMTDQVVKLTDLCDDLGVVRGVWLERCVVMGPAVCIAGGVALGDPQVKEEVAIEHCHFDCPPEQRDAMFWGTRKGLLFGVVLLTAVRFEACRFHNIALLMDPPGVDDDGHVP